MKKATVTLHTPKGDKDVSAFVLDDDGLLAVHRCVGGPGFSLTHIASGMRAHMLPFPTQASAVEYGATISSIVDFAKPTAELKAEIRDDPDNYALMLQIEQRVREKHMKSRSDV